MFTNPGQPILVEIRWGGLPLLCCLGCRGSVFFFFPETNGLVCGLYSFMTIQSNLHCPHYCTFCLFGVCCWTLVGRINILMGSTNKDAYIELKKMHHFLSKKLSYWILKNYMYYSITVCSDFISKGWKSNPSILHIREWVRRLAFPVEIFLRFIQIWGMGVGGLIYQMSRFQILCLFSVFFWRWNF